MKRYLACMVCIFMCLSGFAQDVKCAYNLTKITSYVCVDRITENTARELADTIAGIRERFHSADFVVDFINTEGDFGEASVYVAQTLLEGAQRVAFLVGPNTGHAAEQVAVEMRSNQKAIVIGDVRNGCMTADVELKSYDEYKNAWYDSLHCCEIIPKTVSRYLSENKERMHSRYPDARSLYINYDENAPIIEMLNEVAHEKGIARNDDAFFYSGYMVLCEVRAEMMKQLFPNEKEYYQRSLNLPLDQAINIAREILESARYREILGNPRQS